MSEDTKPWGIFATFALGAVALLVGQMSGIAVVSGLYGFDLRNMGAISRDGGGISRSLHLPFHVAKVSDINRKAYDTD